MGPGRRERRRGRLGGGRSRAVLFRGERWNGQKAGLSGLGIEVYIKVYMYRWGITPFSYAVSIQSYGTGSKISVCTIWFYRITV